MSEHFDLAMIIAELEEQKKTVISVAVSVKNDFMATVEEIEETIEEIDADEVKMKAVVAKLKIMEELEEIQHMLSDLGSKTKKMVDASPDEIQESWDTAKKHMANVEDKVAEVFKK